MVAKPSPTSFIPTFTLLIGGAVLMGGVSTMIGDSGSILGFIACVIGFALEACGMLALVYPAARKHIMHVAILVAMFGMWNSVAPGVLPAAGQDWTRAELVTAGSGILCTVLFAVYLKSFVNARRGNASSSSTPSN